MSFSGKGEFSTEKETKFSGGQMINPLMQDYNFELTKMDPDLYAQIQDLKDHEISLVLKDGDRVNPVKFKLITVTDCIDEHKADFVRDYLKIKELAEQDKQFKAIENAKRKLTLTLKLMEYRTCDFNANWIK